MTEYRLPRYIANVYCGGIFCGNGYLDTITECYKFADDGFCDKLIIKDTETGKTKRIKLLEDK